MAQQYEVSRLERAATDYGKAERKLLLARRALYTEIAVAHDEGQMSLREIARVTGLTSSRIYQVKRDQTGGRPG